MHIDPAPVDSALTRADQARRQHSGRVGDQAAIGAPPSLRLLAYDLPIGSWLVGGDNEDEQFVRWTRTCCQDTAPMRGAATTSTAG